MKNNSEPAFPPMVPDKGYGLTKREYFAGQAMMAIVANAESCRQITREIGTAKAHLYNEVIAALAVKQADALLAQLAKDEE